MSFSNHNALEALWCYTHLFSTVFPYYFSLYHILFAPMLWSLRGCIGTPHCKSLFQPIIPIFFPYHSLELRTSINSCLIAKPPLLDIQHHQLLHSIRCNFNSVVTEKSPPGKSAGTIPFSVIYLTSKMQELEIISASILVGWSCGLLNI